MTDETRSLSDVRIDDRGWGRYLDIPLACPRNRERYKLKYPDTKSRIGEGDRELGDCGIQSALQGIQHRDPARGHQSRVGSQPRKFALQQFAVRSRMSVALPIDAWKLPGALLAEQRISSKSGLVFWSCASPPSGSHASAFACCGGCPVARTVAARSRARTASRRCSGVRCWYRRVICGSR